MTQDTAAAERSAHVTRGQAHTHDAPSIVVETSPGIWQLRRVCELETALREVIEAAEAGCAPAVIARPARRVLASMENRNGR